MTERQITAVKENLVTAHYSKYPQVYVDTHRQILANAGVGDWNKAAPEIALELEVERILNH